MSDIYSDPSTLPAAGAIDAALRQVEEAQP